MKRGVRGCRQGGESRNSRLESPCDGCRLALPLGRAQQQEAAIRGYERLNLGKPAVDLIDVNRLGEESAPKAHGAGLIRRRPFPGHQGEVWGDTTFGAKGLHEIQAAHLGHVEVGDDDVGTGGPRSTPAAVHSMQRAQPRIGKREDLVPSPLAHELEGLPHTGVVIEDKGPQAHEFPLSVTVCEELLVEILGRLVDYESVR